MLETGQLVPINFKGRTFNAVVIDPNGLGEGRPTIGIGYRGMSRHTDVPAQTFVDRVSEIEGINVLRLPSAKAFNVSEIAANGGNVYGSVARNYGEETPPAAASFIKQLLQRFH